MTTESLLRWLAAVGVPSEVVSIGRETDETWCLLRVDPTAAEEGTAWDVFWLEQGNRYDWARFTSEHVACHYLFGRLTWAQVARGAVGTLSPETQG